VLVVLTPALKVLVLSPAVVRMPDQEPDVVGSVPPNLAVTTMELPLAGASVVVHSQNVIHLRILPFLPCRIA
jgi:hypothetical protein